MDVTVRDEYVPKEGAVPFPNLDHMYVDCESIKALVVLTVGIEPEYRGKGFARMLKQRAEDLAVEWGLTAVVASMIENPIMRELNTKMGYALYERGTYAVKRLSK